MWQQRRSRRGHGDPPRAAVEQPHAHLALEGGDLAGEPGLGVPGDLGGRADEPVRHTSTNAFHGVSDIPPS